MIVVLSVAVVVLTLACSCLFFRCQRLEESLDSAYRMLGVHNEALRHLFPHVDIYVDETGVKYEVRK